MALTVYETSSGSSLSAAEVSLLIDAVKTHGRATLLVASFAERERCRVVLARAGVGMGVDVATPATWIAGLWELLGDGRRIAAPVERRMLMASILAACEPEELEPLRDNPGTVRLLADMAAALLPVIVPAPALEAEAPAAPSDAERVVFSLMGRYAAALAERGMVEASEAACLLARIVGADAPACARFVAVRDIAAFPAHVVRLLRAVAAAGEAAWLLNENQVTLASALGPERIVRLGAAGGQFPDARDEAAAAPGPDARSEAAAAPGPDARAEAACEPASAAAACPTPAFLEVAGPHARAAAYADAIAELAGDGREVVVAAARPGDVFDAVAERLAARGIACEAPLACRFGDTQVGRQFTALADLVGRMQEAGEDLERADLWWPAPELADWLYSPLSGMDAFAARRFDKKLRSNRALTPEGVLRALQSFQTQAEAARKKLDHAGPYAQVPAVCASVVSYLWQDRPVSALKALCTVASALPGVAFGAADGAVRANIEVTMAAKAIELVLDTARALDVPQAAAVSVLDGLVVRAMAHGESLDSAQAGHDGEPASGRCPVRFMTVADAALLELGSVDAVFVADVDIESFPLAHEEGAVATLASELGFEAVELEPAARLRDAFSRALAAARGETVMARVTHDRQAKDRYPAAIWTELAAVQRARGGEPAVRAVGEGDIVRDLDPAAGERMGRDRVSCLPPQELGEDAVPYLVLYQQDSNDPERLVPRQLSASQIESYTGCPLCWFISSRVRPSVLDAGFGNMEKGNFVHDVLYRLHARLMEAGVPRVTEANLPVCIDELHAVFAEVRAEHGRNKTSSSGALVAHSALERVQVDEILPQLEGVLRYETGALAPFAPMYLEYSFNELGVEYAGRPLGGRIDRVDVDAEHRAMVIDYKHRADVNAFRLADPTVAKKDETVPADDPDWLPEHTQTLIYAQALRHSELALDARGAIYFATKGSKPAMRGAVSEEFVEEEPGDGRVPGLRAGFPDAEHGGTMDFDALLDRVEETISRRLDELEAGVVTAAETPAARCSFNHDLGFERRNA